MVPAASSSHRREINTKQEEEEARCLLFDNESVREQLLSELSILAMRNRDCVGNTMPSEPHKLRLVLDIIEVGSICPTLGTLLVECPPRLDRVLDETLTRWFHHESAMALSGGRSGCHHLSSVTQSSSTHALDDEDGRECPICIWTHQFPSAFWRALCSRVVIVTVCTAPSALPSFLAAFAQHSPLQRPCDLAIGAMQWVQIIGYTTSVFFLHRELTDPVPMVELQPVCSNHGKVVGQPPLWLDLSVLPKSEMREVAVVGERVHVIGLLDVVCYSFGMVLYSKRGNAASSVHLVLEVRTARTPKLVSPLSHNPLIVAAAATPESPSPIPECHDAFDVKVEREARALLQAKCCWEGVAGAAAFASARAIGGFCQPHGVSRVEAIFAASSAFLLPTALWAVVGMALSASMVSYGNIVASVVGPPDTLCVLETFLLELGAETNIVLPVLHGMENALLPTYARISASQAVIPLQIDSGNCIESVRGGLLNMAHQRVVMIPSLHALSASALHAIQGVIGQHEHIVVREGAQQVTCRAVGTVIGITQETMVMQHQYLFHFLERGDVVINISPSSLRSLEEQADVILGMVPLGDGLDDAVTHEFFERCKRQWDTWCGWALNPTVDEPLMPQLSPACAKLLHTFFIAAKTICAEAADTCMMSTLVKLTCTHALLRQRAHQGVARKTDNGTCSLACVCHVVGMDDDDSTALVDAVVAIALCDASLKFVAGTSLIGEPSVFELIAGDEGFSVVQFTRQLQKHLVRSVPGI